MKNGRPQGCVVAVYNAKGNQINEVSTDSMGVGYIKDLAPGTYTLKFLNSSRDPYNLEREVTVSEGESVILDIELTESNVDSSSG